MKTRAIEETGRRGLRDYIHKKETITLRRTRLVKTERSGNFNTLSPFTHCNFMFSMVRHARVRQSFSLNRSKYEEGYPVSQRCQIVIIPSNPTTLLLSMLFETQST